jgi:hypothetical protein
MIKETVTYTNFDGKEVTEDFYFNLTEAELVEMEYSVAGGYDKWIQKIIAADDNATLISLLKDMLLKAYGEKSLDGKRFIKNQEIRDSFAASEAYSKLFIKLSTDTEAASRFANGILPAKRNSGNTPQVKS